MRFQRHKKPLAETPKPPREHRADVTEIFIKKTDKGLKAYHESFMSNSDHCEFKSFRYNEPIETTLHFSIGFWNFGRKLSMFFNQHTTLARFFDWFHYAQNVSYPVGYTHEEGKADPLEINVKNPNNFCTLEKHPGNIDINWSQINYDLSKNTTIKGMHQDIAMLFKGHKDINWNPLILVAIIVVAIACVAVLGFYFMGHHATQAAQNITITIPNTPYPSPFRG